LIGFDRSIDEMKSKLVIHFLESLGEKTRVAYRNDLQSLSEFLRILSIEEMAQVFVGLEHGKANLVVIEWRSYLKTNGMAVSSINRRLAAVRSLVAFARTLGIISWELEIKNFKSTPYRDVRGPGQTAYERMLDYLDNNRSKKTIRDKAMLVLFHDLGLRRAELASLNFEDFDLGESAMVAVSGKGRHEKELLSIPLETSRILNDWVRVRGDQPGPFFISCDRAKKGDGRLTPNGIYEVIKALGKRIGIETHPHALRHLAITEACKLAQANGFGLEEVLDFSRHAHVNTLMIYRDRERNVQGSISSLLSKRESK
jgi:integrase/recombinase XerC